MHITALHCDGKALLSFDHGWKPDQCSEVGWRCHIRWRSLAFVPTHWCTLKHCTAHKSTSIHWKAVHWKIHQQSLCFALRCPPPDSWFECTMDFLQAALAASCPTHRYNQLHCSGLYYVYSIYWQKVFCPCRVKRLAVQMAPAIPILVTKGVRK